MLALGYFGHSPKFFIFALIAAGGMAVAFWKVWRTKPELPSGFQVEEAQAPSLWATVRDLAQQVGTRAPDEIQLVAEVNAAVVEDVRWLGLVGGRRFLSVGTPLVQTFTVDQLRSVVAHTEFTFRGKRLVSMEEFTNHAAQARRQRVADVFYRAAGCVANVQAPGMHTVVDIIQSGRHGELVRAVSEDAFPRAVQAAVSAEAVRCGRARWELSWAHAPRLVDQSGEPFPVKDIAAPLIAGDAAGSQAVLDRILTRSDKT